ncbi:MAG: hypothetical protein AAF787_10175 [Chloroflexota bacterium]
MQSNPAWSLPPDSGSYGHRTFPPAQLHILAYHHGKAITESKPQ